MRRSCISLHVPRSIGDRRGGRKHCAVIEPQSGQAGNGAALGRQTIPSRPHGQLLLPLVRLDLVHVAGLDIPLDGHEPGRLGRPHQVEAGLRPDDDGVGPVVQLVTHPAGAPVPAIPKRRQPIRVQPLTVPQ